MTTQAGKTHCTWGGFVFELKTIPLDSRTVATDYRYAALPHLGNDVGYQFLGKGEDTVHLTGKLAPGTKVGKVSSVQELRDKAKTGKAFDLILSPTGESLGKFYCTRIEERHQDMFEGFGFGVEVAITFLKDGGS